MKLTGNKIWVMASYFTNEWEEDLKNIQLNFLETYKIIKFKNQVIDTFNKLQETAVQISVSLNGVEDKANGTITVPPENVEEQVKKLNELGVSEHEFDDITINFTKDDKLPANPKFMDLMFKFLNYKED